MQSNKALQLEIYGNCAEFADYTDYMSYCWKDVQRALKKTDIAIEFVSIEKDMSPLGNGMAALVLTREMEYPVVVPIKDIFEIRRLEHDGDLFEVTTNLLWGDIEKYLEGKKRIFFSADGDFNIMGIEYIQYNGKPVSEQYEVYRLSSTKELCSRPKKSKIRKVILLGGINYNEHLETSTDTMQNYRGAGDIYGFASLPNTLYEVNGVQTILKGKNIEDVTLLTDTEATADAFMQLSGSGVNLLHIATHGMYRENTQLSDTESMENSFLVFAGANMDANAVVSASEVAAMNLRQCDIAILSACETALGKSGNDGIFGLQRGFKNAGVKTILMSLKNVYDDVTAKLMVSFYEYLMNGSTKREALVKAQRDIRNKGYVDAEYWTPFILLDAY